MKIPHDSTFLVARKMKLMTIFPIETKLVGSDDDDDDGCHDKSFNHHHLFVNFYEEL